MADEPDNLVLQLLRRMDAKFDRISDDMQDIKIRMTCRRGGGRRRRVSIGARSR